MSRIGAFVCHCGHNIAGTVDVRSVVEEIRQRHPGVVFAVDYKYMCSDPGQKLIQESIREWNLDGVVIAACSPAMHETTFRKTVAAAGLNPFRCESANIREQVSWVHQKDKSGATRKAVEITCSVIDKVSQNQGLEELGFPIHRTALVIGAGVAGMRAALDVAEAGFPVVLVEKEAEAGGNFRKLSGSFLNFEAAPDLLQQMVQRIRHHPGIRLLTRARVVETSGSVGNFQVRLGLESEADGRTETINAGAVVVATGYQSYPLPSLPRLGGGTNPDVVDGLAFETMLREGTIRRPSDGNPPREVVFIQCAGSRDSEQGVAYCSKVCCMYVAKQAMAFMKAVPESQAYVFHSDIRSAGKGYEEYVQSAMSGHRVLYLRGEVEKIGLEGKKTMVGGMDSLSGRKVEVAADLVVLATPMIPNQSAAELGRVLRIARDKDGFFNEAHVKLRPVETLTAGIFLAGAAQGPKDVPETIAQADAAAAKVLQLFSQQTLTRSPLVATVAGEVCAACGICVEACPYQAREIDSLRCAAVVNASLCQGCGACVAACPNKACELMNSRPEQILSMLDHLIP